MHPTVIPELRTEYDSACARGLDHRWSLREAFVLTYRITSNNGTYRSREELIAFVAVYLRKLGVRRAAKVAARFVDDHAWLRRHKGETAGSVARAVVDAVPDLYCGGAYASCFSRTTP